MSTRLTLINASARNLVAAVTGSKTTFSVSSFPEGCKPIPHFYKVSYFDAQHKWTSKIVEAYSASQAADQLGLKAGYNCFVSCQIRRKP